MLNKMTILFFLIDDLLLFLTLEAVQWKYCRSIDSRIRFYTICVRRNLRATWLLVFVFERSLI